jgi:sulfate adenylyltransferase large subunit
MTHLSAAAPALQEPESSASRPRGLLRFITCGSVDDGKSTLIGRLLADTGNIADDQIAALAADSRRFGTQDGAIDYALLLDGLAAEREQGITIDVAYRYFSTPRRAFIVADAPGHRQYTRNMATGASLAEMAVMLVDARQGVLEQTRRHTLIVALLGVREIALAVNKMDLVGYAQPAFAAIEAEYRAFAAPLGLRVTAIPLCARDGENVTARSSRMPWHDGPTLLAHLETADVSAPAGAAALRFPVQLALRPDAEFRGCAGMVAAGSVAVGDAVVVLPSGQRSTVARIASADGDLARADAGQSVALVLADDLDVARGDMIASAARPAMLADRIEARVLWSSETPLDAARDYALKVGTATVPARLDAPTRGVDVATGASVPIAELALNAIGDVSVRLDRSVPLDAYESCRATGGFILIDRLSNETVAMGLVQSARQSRRLALPSLPPSRERLWRSAAKAVTWRTAGSVGTFGFAWAFTHSVPVAASIIGFEVLTKVALYYVHERVWARVRNGLTTD